MKYLLEKANKKELEEKIYKYIVDEYFDSGNISAREIKIRIYVDTYDLTDPLIEMDVKGNLMDITQSKLFVFYENKHKRRFSLFENNEGHYFPPSEIANKIATGKLKFQLEEKANKNLLEEKIHKDIIDKYFDGGNISERIVITKRSFLPSTQKGKLVCRQPGKFFILYKGEFAEKENILPSKVAEYITKDIIRINEIEQNLSGAINEIEKRKYLEIVDKYFNGGNIFERDVIIKGDRFFEVKKLSGKIINMRQSMLFILFIKTRDVGQPLMPSEIANKIATGEIKFI